MRLREETQILALRLSFSLSLRLSFSPSLRLLLRVRRFARAGAQFGGDVVQTNVAFDHQDQQMVKQVADFGRELFAAFVIAGVLRRDYRLGGFLADFLEYLVEAAVEQIARVGAFGALVLPLLDKFEEVLKLYPQIHRGDVDQRDRGLNAFNYGGGLLPVLFPILLPTLFPTLFPALFPALF